MHDAYVVVGSLFPPRTSNYLPLFPLTRPSCCMRGLLVAMAERVRRPTFFERALFKAPFRASDAFFGGKLLGISEG